MLIRNKYVVKSDILTWYISGEPRSFNFGIQCVFCKRRRDVTPQHSVKTAIHLKASHAICPKRVFPPSILFEKSRHVIHLRFQSALAFDPPIPPALQISDFLASKRGPNLVRSFDEPPTLVRGLKLKSAHEVLEFDFVGITSFPDPLS
ncbi:hypothetical protein AVEN_71082-1 [Araneus ventricosus]|uniref:Uncharacterized protein n=1 Tax=Araneus ventricosus TaxID=182803 RepID=A0A4Y2RET7_ARAVE|nr:hypothetical protein AVEN_71082-1 [Araneus ventricosus]